MRRILSILYVAIALFPVPASAFEAGAAKVDITPPAGTPLNGYLDRLGRGAVGAHDPIWARCLYLDDGETNVFLVSADLCVINPELRRRALELAPPEVPKEHVILTATHTHNGPGGLVQPLLFRPISGRFIPELLESTARAIAGVMSQAYQGRKRATVGYGTAKQIVLTENRREDGGPFDEQIGVLRVDDSDGNPIAVLANFAAHPTTAPKESHYEFSADFAGYFYNAVEEMTSPGCVAMFLNGGFADQQCANPEDKSGWEHTESIGRLLAIRTKEAVNRITCNEASLHAGYAEPALPLTLAKSHLPAKAVIQTLEIGDLALVFLPGEPCVAIALELRRQALERGYAAQFTVAPANDHLFYLVPRGSYAAGDYEASLSFYGPRIEDWVYRHVDALMSRGAASPEASTPDAPPIPLSPGARLNLAGGPRERGSLWGSLLQAQAARAYEDGVLAPVRESPPRHFAQFAQWLPPFLDLSNLELLALAAEARPLLRDLPGEAVTELEGAAEGAGLPFDALWLSQTLAHARTVAAPRVAFVSVAGARAGADDLLVAASLKWPDSDALPLVLDVKPSKGYRYLCAGQPGLLGAFAGMNARGVVICAEPAPDIPEPVTLRAPIELSVKKALQTASNSGEAEALLRELNGAQGWSILIADSAAPRASLLHFGDSPETLAPIKGLLSNSDAPGAHAQPQDLKASLLDERIIGSREMTDAVLELAAIEEQGSRCIVLFEPKARRVRVSFSAAAQPAGAFETYFLNEDAS